MSHDARDDEGGTLKLAVRGLDLVLARVGDFFDLFDLSFLVAGVACMAALVYGDHLYGYLPLPSMSLPMTVTAVIGCYVLGVVCFASGRKVRCGLARGRGASSPGDRVHATLAQHGLRVRRWQAYRDGGALYTRLWAELREEPRLAASYRLARRYWVMAANCDGIAMAAVAWIAVIALAWGTRLVADIGGARAVAVVGTIAPERMPPLGASVLAVLALGAMVRTCFHEARRFEEFQLGEVVAALALTVASDAAAETPPLAVAAAGGTPSDETPPKV